MKKLRWLFWIFVILFLWLLVSRGTELAALGRTLASGRWEWVLGAAALQLAYYLVYTTLYQAAFSAVDVRSRVRDLLPVMFASVFLNVAAPLAGTSGSALFVDDARRRGEAPGRAAAGTLLVLVADFASFLLVLVTGMAILFSAHDLKVFEIVAAILLLLLVTGLTLTLLLGLWWPDQLQRLLGWVQRIANRAAARLHRPPLFSEDWAGRNSAEYIEAALAIAAHPPRLWRVLLVALAAHIIDLLSLLALFLAFHQPVHAGLLVAGYSMGILFWIISITPQGIGVVEGTMALVFTSLGVPAERSAVIALAFRGLTFWIPLLLGFLLLRRMRMFGPAARPAGDHWGRRLVALLTALMGIINVLSAVTRSLPERMSWLAQLSPLEVRHGGRFAAAVAGFALLLLAQGLWRRKRAAWVLAEIVLVVSAASHLVKGLDYEEAVFALALAGWLAFLRPHFHARSDPPSLRQGFIALAAAALFTFFYGTAGFYLLNREFKTHFLLLDALRQTAAMFFQFNNPGLEPVTGLGRYFAGSIYGISLVAFGYAALQMIRPVLLRHPTTAAERDAARAVIERYGKTSLAAFALLPDKNYFFTPGGSLIQYVVQGRVALTLGDPIGPAEDAAAAIRAFQDLCDRSDWQPAFYQVLPESLSLYQAAGFQALPIGQEGIVRLDSFTLEGRENKGLRSAYNKWLRNGCQAKVCHPPHPPETLADLREISDAWLALVHGSEKHFSLGWFDEEYLNRCPIMIVTNAEEQRLAFANLLPEYQRNESTLDLMRYRPNLENGLMDFLFVSLLTWARSQGLATFNLGLSSLYGVGDDPNDPAVARALHYIYEHVSRFYNFKGLHAFKEKFHPVWEPRYLIYPDTASLPLVTLAMIRADSGDDLIGPYLRPKK
jgi:phosphatidylglycerol lysyltransferase